MLKMRTGVETTGNNIGIEDIFKSKKPGLNIFKQTALYFIFASAFLPLNFLFSLYVLFGTAFYLIISLTFSFFLSLNWDNCPSIRVIKHFPKGSVQG